MASRTMNLTQSMTKEEFETIPLNLSWRMLLRISALGMLLLLLVTMVTLRDLLAAGLVVILVAGLVLLLARGRLLGLIFTLVTRVVMLRLPEERLGALILGFLFADIGFYTLTGAATNLLSGATGIAVLLPASLAAFALTGFVSAVMVLWNPTRSSQPSRGTLYWAALVLLLACIVGGIALLSRPQTMRAAASSDITLVTKDIAYSKSALTASAGEIVVELDNHDLFWHTFTIPELGVDLKVPMQSSQQVHFRAPPGSYRFFCTIPGHEVLGMEGMLNVK